jgi:hypothetical protein
MRTISIVGGWRRRHAEKLDRNRQREAALGLPDIVRGKIIIPLEGSLYVAKYIRSRCQ